MRFASTLVCVLATGCGLAPNDELGLRQHQLALLQVASFDQRDNLNGLWYNAFDGQQPTLKSFAKQCRGPLEFDRRTLICEGSDDRKLVLSLVGQQIGNIPTTCVDNTSVSPDLTAAACWDEYATTLHLDESGIERGEVFSRKPSVNDPPIFTPPSWAPNSESFYFATEGKIYRYLRQTHVTATVGKVRGDWPLVSPDGSRLLYRDGGTGRAAVIELNAASNTPPLIGDGDLLYPSSWSSDGNYVLLVMRRRFELVIWRLSDGARQHINLPDEDYPSQSPYRLIQLSQAQLVE